MRISGYRTMWVVAMFDLPTDSKKARRAYTHFTKHLKREGFTRLQFSVYARYCNSTEHGQTQIGRIERNLPPDGEVRVLTITEKQFQRMRVFWGKVRKPPEEPPCQLQLF